MRILLLKPKWNVGYGQMRYARRVKFPVLALGILAALSRDHEVKVVDASWGEIPWDEKFDLVGITCATFASSDVYDIAKRFREMGVKVVIGGVHPTIMPDEAVLHADAIVVGEAEYVWESLVKDAERGKLEKIYRSPRPTDMADVPFARRDLLEESSWFTSLEASRGCSNKCKFCYLPETPWASFRGRPIELVVEELRRIPQKVFCFVDENVFSDRDYAIRLFKAIAPLKKSWIVQMPTDRGMDEELLDVMAEAGCFYVYLGLQSFNKDSLDNARIHHAPRVEKFRDIINNLHKRKIIISGFFVFGFDGDTRDSFQTTVEVIKDLGIDDVGMFVATPYPGTGFHAQLQSEGRLIESMPRDAFGWFKAVYHPKHMTPEELENGVKKAYDSLDSHFRRRLLWVIKAQWSLILKNPSVGAAFWLGKTKHGNSAYRNS